VNDLYISDKLFKVIRERRLTIVEALTEGPVNDYAAFRHLRAKFEAWNEVESELRLLLKNERDTDNE